MIEQSHRSLLPSSSSDLESLQRRANARRKRHRQSSAALQANWLQVRTAFGSPARSVVRLPARFLLHAIIVLMLPLAVALTQIRAGVMLPVQQPSAPTISDDLAVPVAPLSLDATLTIGDAPLADEGEIPVPLSLVSRTAALAPVIVDATIAGERIYLRNGPGTEYDAVNRISGNAPVQVIGRFGDWYQVRERVDTPVYWVSGALLTMPEGSIYTLFELQQDQIPPPPPPKVATVNEAGLQLRDGPGTNYIPMSKFEAGQQLDLIERYQDWYHVGIPGGTDGWVKGEFLAIDSAMNSRLLEAETIPDPNPALVGIITDNSVNLRQGPDSKYGKVKMLDAGVQVDLVGKYNDWFKVQLGDGTKAWIFRDLLNVSERVVRRVPVTSDFPALPKPKVQTVTAKGNTSRSSGPDLANLPASGDVASYAMNYVGSRYTWGGASPKGFDCSGLTQYVYSKYGVSLPHSSSAQFSGGYGAKVGSTDQLVAGDLVFFVGTGGGRGITHVALYVGGGRMVHAMTPKLGVQVSNINERYWQQHFYSGIRVRR